MTSDHVHVFQTIERVLIIAGCLLVLYACYLFSRDQEGRFPRPAVVESGGSLAVKGQSVTMTPAGVDTDQIRHRNIFELAPLSVQTEMPDGTSQFLPSHLKIVGVLIGHPSEVIIEDSQLQQTYFVKEGESSGPLQVFSVTKDNAIIEYQGQTFQVSLRR